MMEIYFTTMANKLIVWVLLVSVLYNVFDPSYAASAGEVTAETWKTFDQINEHMNVVISEKYTVVKSIINTLRNLTEQILSDQESRNASSTSFDVAQAEKRLMNDSDNIVSAVSIAAGRICTEGDTIRLALYTNSQAVIESIDRAIKSAMAGEFPEANNTNFQNIKRETQTAILYFGRNAIDLTSSCLNTDNRTDVTGVIGTAANEIQKSLSFSVEYVFNVIAIFGAVVSDKSSYDVDDVLTGIDSNLVNALLAIASFAAYLFGLIEGLYLDRVLGGTSIVDDLFKLRYVELITLNYLPDAYDPIATAMANTLERRTNVTEIGRLDYFPATLTNQSATSIGLARALYPGIDIIQATQPTSALEVTAVEAIIPVVTEFLATTWFGSVGLADNNGLLCSTIPVTIEAIDVSQVPLVAAFTTLLYVVLVNGLAGTLSAASLIPIIQDTIYYGALANSYIYEGSQYLSKIICANEGATQNDFVQIRYFLGQTIVSMIQFSKNVARSILAEVLINDGYIVDIYQGGSHNGSIVVNIGNNLSDILDNLRSLISQNRLDFLALQNGNSSIVDDLTGALGISL